MPTGCNRLDLDCCFFYLFLILTFAMGAFIVYNWYMGRFIFLLLKGKAGGRKGGRVEEEGEGKSGEKTQPRIVL